MTTGIIKKENGRTSLPAKSFSGLVDQVFQNNLSRFFEDDLWGFDGVNQQNSVPVNLSETDKTYEMQLVAPGFEKEDFKIHLEGEFLTVSIENKEGMNQENKNERWIRKEYKTPSFSRSFRLDETLDENKITAEYINGVLYITLPKKEGAQRLSRNIEIK